MRRDFGCERSESANRRAQDHKVRAANGIGGVFENLIGEVEPAGRLPRCLRPCACRYPRGKLAPAHDMAKRGADKADADEGDLFETWDLSF